jgi:serine/threonine-protein kinase
VSPVDDRLALAANDDIWIHDPARGVRSRLTTDRGRDGSPLWTSDGQEIIFNSSRAGYPALFRRRADGTGSEKKILERSKDLINLRVNGWSPDGRQLLFTETSLNNRSAIGQIAIEAPSDVRMLLQTEFSNDRPVVSPEGSWMAFESNVSGRYEIYLERYPGLGNRQAISTDGGRLPLWSRNGRELFFSSLDGRQMLSVPVQSGTPIARPQVLFGFVMLPIQGSERPYDIAPDGKFLMIRRGQAEATADAASNLILVQNWFEELKRLVPVTN